MPRDGAAELPLNANADILGIEVPEQPQLAETQQPKPEKTASWVQRFFLMPQLLLMQPFLQVQTFLVTHQSLLHCLFFSWCTRRFLAHQVLLQGLRCQSLLLMQASLLVLSRSLLPVFSRSCPGP